MTVESWLAAAVADAERRGLPELKPLLETLARSTAGLRSSHAALAAAAGHADTCAASTPAGEPRAAGGQRRKDD